jgi:hypothetical protein
VSEWSEQVRRRVEAASPGPWKLARDPRNEMLLVFDANARLIAGEADAVFIASAREDVPRLLREVQQLQMANDQARATIAALKQWADEIVSSARESVADGSSKKRQRGEVRSMFFLSYAAERVLALIGESGEPSEVPQDAVGRPDFTRFAGDPASLKASTAAPPITVPSPPGSSRSVRRVGLPVMLRQSLSIPSSLMTLWRRVLSAIRSRRQRI